MTDHVELFRRRIIEACEESELSDISIMAIFYGSMLVYGYESTVEEMEEIMDLGRKMAEDTVQQERARAMN